MVKNIVHCESQKLKEITKFLYFNSFLYKCNTMSNYNMHIIYNTYCVIGRMD